MTVALEHGPVDGDGSPIAPGCAGRVRVHPLATNLLPSPETAWTHDGG